jgi:DNA-binding MarR family transcriptional regulator
MLPAIVASAAAQKNMVPRTDLGEPGWAFWERRSLNPHRVVGLLPRAMGELAADLDVRLSTMTGVVDQLEEKGLVERVDHPDDRRSLHVKLTVKGQTLYHDAHDAFLSHLAPLFDGRTPTVRRQALEFLAEIIRAVQGWRDNPRRVRRHGKTNS